MSVTATDALGSLFNPTENVCFRVFDDKKGGVFKGAKLQCECGKYASIEETLKNHNALNRGIFYVVNYGGQDDSAITRINAQFVEMDTGNFDEQQKKVDDFPLPPSMIIKTQKPITCQTICEKGFRCPKFAAGACPVKSPAALCYQPLDSDTLLEILSELPVTGKTIDDLQTAKNYISEYLYNQDVVIADAIFNSEMRDHFKFKTSFLKPLMAIYIRR